MLSRPLRQWMLGSRRSLKKAGLVAEHSRLLQRRQAAEHQLSRLQQQQGEQVKSLLTSLAAAADSGNLPTQAVPVRRAVASSRGVAVAEVEACAEGAAGGQGSALAPTGAARASSESHGAA
jgi:hypothetical protein